MIDTSGPAFPSCSVAVGFDAVSRQVIQTEGLTIRDWFAGQALIGLISSGIFTDANKEAYRIADSMIQQRSLTKDGSP